MFRTIVASLLLLFASASWASHAVFLSESPDRSNPVLLDGRDVAGEIYVFVSPDSDVDQVTFLVDGAVQQTEGLAPFDLGGTAANFDALPYDTTQLTDGPHSLTAEILLNGGDVETVVAGFTVSNDIPQLDFSAASVLLAAGETDAPAQATVSLSASDGSATAFSLAVTTDSPWLSVAGDSTTTPATVTLTADPAVSGVGTFDAQVVASADDGSLADDTLAVEFTVTSESYMLLSGADADRSPAGALGGSTVSGDLFVFVEPETSISQVEFYLDDPGRSGSPIQTEGRAPYDFAGTRPDDTAYAFDTTSLADGPHTITAAITFDSGALTVIDAGFDVDNGGSANQPPTPSFTADCIDLDCSFDASASSDPDGTIAAYDWTFGDGASGTGVTAAHAYAAAGTYTVTLTVTDDAGATASTSQEIGVTAPNTAPDAVFDAACSGLDCSFDATASSDADGTIAAYDWDFGDGAVGTGVTADHVYAADGTYTVTLTVTDDDGATASTSQSVAVTADNQLPTADLQVTCADLDCTFDGSGSSDPDGTIVAHDWDFGDGFTATGSVASHAYASAGTYLVTLTVTDDDGGTVSAIQSIDVVSGNGLPTADWTVSCAGRSCSFDGSTSTDPEGNITDYAWDFGDGTTGSGALVTHDYGADGQYTVSLVVTDGAGQTDTQTKTITASSATGCPDISPLDCSDVRKLSDVVLEFDGTSGGVVDANGIGTGFTMVDPPTNPGNPSPDPDAPGYWPERLALNSSLGLLQIETSAGIQFEANNSQDNALGIGLNLPSAALTLRSSVVDLPAAPGGWAQAGVWFGSADNFGRGTAEDDYIKLVVASPRSGEYILEVSREENGVRVDYRQIELSTSVTSVGFELVIDPGNRSVRASYDTGAGFVLMEVYNGLPDEWFSFDQAGIDPTVATRSYGGIFATHRRASGPLTFSFDRFEIAEGAKSGPEGTFDFDRWEIPVSLPTAMTWGPDDRLYVAELFGRIHALTLDRANRVVLDDEIIDTLPNSYGADRLTLGLTVDPASTPDNVILWAAHSDGSLNNGQENSGTVSRLSGPGFATIDDRITGLPRAIANHAINHIEFGPDGRLYIAAGGNTGAGAANLSSSEFGDRPEQPLSAAILAADVNDPNFQGFCATPIGEFGVPATCDVSVYASGLRNSYDIAWHSNGSLYATDNGLGVTGTVPPFTTPPCTELADPVADNPGTQPDLLLRLEAGMYYGHPNPYRDECVFKDGTFQGAAPLPNYVPPMFELGNNLSANGILEYAGDAFYGKLLGQLLISNFSTGDSLTRIEVSPDGTSVVEGATLAVNFTDPLPITQDPEGNLYVGELNASTIQVLEPLPMIPAPIGAWTARQPLPEQLLDAGGASLDGDVYVVGGKTSAAHVSTVRRYDPVSDSWTTLAPLPGEAVENPAVVGLDGKLYAFGGSTAPFSGAVANAHVYDPAAGTWAALPPMSVARGGAAVAVLDGRIHVIGGMDANGASLASVEVFDPVAGTWSAGVPLQTRRDNAGAAAINGKLYVFGGRIRNADASVVNGGLTSLEILDPAIGSWVYGTSMTTGRRAMAVGTVGGYIQVMGGEGPLTSANEEYDPATDTWRALTPMVTARHGVAAATIGGDVYTVGGGDVAGSAFTDVNEVFAY